MSKPIIIYGSARSGTSLLSRIVGSHPNIAVPFESHLYNTFFPWLKYYGDLSLGKNRERLVDDILSTHVMKDWSPMPIKQDILAKIDRFDFHGIVEALILSWAEQSGKSRWGEKTPWHLFYWQEIEKGFPDSKIIHIVRDGRDASISWKKARFGPKHYFHLANRWKKYLEKIDEVKQIVPSDRFLEIRYEDLLLDIESKSKEICAFIGEDYSPKMLEFYKSKIPYPTDKQNNENLSKPLDANNKEKWRHLLCDKDLRIIESVAGDYLQKYGYKLMTPINQRKISSIEKIKIKYIVHPPKKIYSMTKNTKGMWDALQRVKIYLRLRLKAIAGIN